MSEKKEIQSTENAKLYELGFHIIPTATEKEVASVFSKIKEVIIKNNGSVVKEGEPKLTKLAYIIVKKIKAKNERFSNAFFAWVKFNAESSDIAGVKKSLDANNDIIRYLIVKTVDDDEHSTVKLAEEESEVEEGEEDEVEETEEGEKTEGTEEVKETEVTEKNEKIEKNEEVEKEKEIETEASPESSEEVLK